jgi:carboxyl-terminal processing protease
MIPMKAPLAIVAFCSFNPAPFTSSFQPTFSRKAIALSSDPRNKFESYSLSRWAHNEELDLENAKIAKTIDPLSRAVRDVSTVMFASMIFLFSSIAQPASIVWADEGTTPQESTIVQAPTKSNEASVTDEVWNLVNKYFIDRTFNGQDWNEVRTKFVDANKDVENDKDMKLVTEMVQSLGDKYTRMLDGQAYAAIQKFDLIGVGVTLMPNANKEIIVGAPPIGGSPSAKAGLVSGDFVTAVNGLSTSGRTAFDIIDQISEAPDAKTVSFSIRRQGENDLPREGKTFDVTMERQNLMLVKDPVQYKLTEQRTDGTNVGYIRITEFNSLVNSKLQDALKDLKKQGANAFVMDLRSNTGGAFQSAVEISALFFEDRVATYVIDSNNVELPFRTPKGKLAIDPQFPMVIWIDGFSASASEVLAGSLHDNCRAVTMGDKSFGKGLIQAVYGLKNGAGLVLTVARYVTPSGNDIQGIGITPDIAGNTPAPVLVPVLSSNTSKVNFEEIKKRLDPSFCALPQERTTKNTVAGSR